MAIVRSILSALLLLQADAIHEPASFFGGFAEMESTYNQDAIPDPHGVEHGWQGGGHMVHPFDRRGNVFRLARWFDETPSNGENGAYQTHFPAAQFQLGRNRNRDWKHTAEGWVQDYDHSRYTGQGTDIRKMPEWFESDISQIDKFGRHAAPQSHEGALGRTYKVETQKRVLRCESNGCSVFDNIFDGFGLVNGTISECKMDLNIFPTGYETTAHDRSTRTTEWKLNGAVVKQECFQHGNEAQDWAKRGETECSEVNASLVVSRPSFGCIADLDVTTYARTGRLELEGTVAPMAEPCPYLGGFLNAEATVRCKVPVTARVEVPVVEDKLRIRQAVAERSNMETADPWSQLQWGSVAPVRKGGAPQPQPEDARRGFLAAQ